MAGKGGSAVTGGGSLQRVVLTRTLQHPFTLYPAAIGLLGMLGLALFGPILPALFAAGTGLSVGLLHFLAQVFLRSDRIAAAHLKEIHERLDTQRREVLEKLETRLKDAAGLKLGDGYGQRAGDQLRMIGARFELLQSLLAEKFKPTELTFSRYFITGEQAYLSVLDNLDSIASRMQSVSTINAGRLRERIAAIGCQKPVPAADEKELHTLRERLRLRDEQLERVNALLTFNEGAITEFDRVNTAIAEVKGANAQASVDLETAVRELEVLAARARRLIH